ncbi:MAG TPA: hemolysin family protein [Spirochaetota bacterium]|nr:hemolysin family protein [Spirochaetota bacterium]HPL19304.1 hemolysin family protein [Spirochaetota bacterium]HQF07751.1 hemolysin family protein [Spirochaetota bacterium]HQH96804.1 hemolysin family protein [Spirochaetota bacterium]HQJ70689.1 hemolysin family protein [Spirochaetota bacterium]
MMVLLAKYHAYITLIGIMMFLSFFFSGTETALLTSNRFYLESLAKTGNRRAKLSLKIVDTIENAMGMILIGNNIVNISSAAFITYIATTAFMLTEPGMLVVTAVQTILFLIICEVTPKVVARARAEAFLMFFSYPIHILLFIMKPAVGVSLLFAQALKSMVGITDSGRSSVRSREEIDILFKIGEEEGVINVEHHEYVSEILSFRGMTAREIMTPTIDIVSIDIESSVRELADLIVRTRFSRIPVYSGRVDNLVGYVFYRDILKHRGAKKIADVMNKVHYVPTTKRIVELYNEMVENLIPMVFIVDEHGAVVGMVTHEDIAEEVVGEIQTRDQSEEELVVEMGRGKFLLSGNMDIEYFMRSFNIHIDKKGFETLAGFIEYRLGRIPKKGDRLDYEKYTFIIDQATERSIEKVIVQTLKNKKKVSGQP